MHASPDGRMQRVLQVSMAATGLYVLATFVFGLRAHSLALLSESGHNLSDLAAIVLSFVAVHFQSRPPNDSKTFGYQRAGVLAAFVNALTLIVLSVWIAVSAIARLHTPVATHARTMMLVAVAGVLMNGGIALLLWRGMRSQNGHGSGSDVNLRSVFLHMMGDTLSTAAVIAGGAAIAITGMRWIDPVLSIGIAALILWSSVGIVRETLHILLEGTPRDVLLADVRAQMLSVDGVIEVHDLHLWSLGSDSHALASHIIVADGLMSERAAVMDRVECALRDRFHIFHTTLQMEAEGCMISRGCAQMPEQARFGEPHLHAHSHHGHAHG
jgi:cobalt-zinc-cadmium efflux system protein